MIFVLKNEKVIATHSDNQLDIILNAYGNAEFYTGSKSAYDAENDTIDKVECVLVDSGRLSNKQAKSLALDNIVVTIDAMPFQVRPCDLSNFNEAISIGGNHKWRLANNTKAIVTSEQLSMALELARPIYIGIEDAYTDTLPEFSPM